MMFSSLFCTTLAGTFVLASAAIAGSSDCCFANGTPGCDDAACESAVCAVDPFCCDTSWDTICASTAATLCADLCAGGGGSCPPSDHDCFTTGGPGCTDIECCELVCAADPFCCETAWDGLCVTGAQNLCGGGGGVPNDNCANAITITDGVTAFSTVGASTDGPPLPPQCDKGFGLAFVNDIWFNYVATCNGLITVSTCGTANFDTRLAAYIGSCTALSLVACNDDGPGCPGFTSIMEWFGTEGETYRIRLGGFGGSGSGTLSVQCGASSSSDCCFANGTPGCDDADCEAFVCSIDPFCCDTEWDAICASTALEVCEELCAGGGGVCPPSDHDCFTTGGPGCTDIECCELVCAADPFCCETAWDALCVGGATALCDPPTGELDCPDGASEEGVACGSDANNGCNLDVPAFGEISCGETICGTAFAEGGTRDTDWYEITLTQQTSVTFSGTAEFALVIGIVDTGGVPDCKLATALNPFATAAPFATASFTTCLEAGTYWFFVAPSVFEGVFCGINDLYVVTLDCDICEFDECDENADVVVTQSNSPVASAGQVACAAAGVTTANQFARSFDLGTGSTAGEDYLLTCVDFGFSNSGAPVAATLNVYLDTDGGAPVNPLIDLSLIGSLNLTLETTGATNRLVTFPEPICVPANSLLVIELDIEASTNGFAVVGGNTAGFTGPTYIRSEACGITNFVSYASIGFPDANWALTVNGSVGCEDPGTPCPWDLNGDGVVDGADLGALLNQWGPCPGCSADFNGDGVVDGADLGALLNAWGNCP